jgi:hypothetical protein
MTIRYHRAALTILASLIAASIACSQRSAMEDEPAPIGIETSQLRVTLENRTGMPVSNVSVELIGTTVFTATHPRIESGAKHHVPLNLFRGRDGTPFDLRVARPRTVKVRCVGPDGTVFNAEARWR